MTAAKVMEWISEKQYLLAPLKYKTPAILGEYMRYWAYFKKDVRKYYRTKIQPSIDPYLIKYGVTYLADKDLKDVENVKPN